MSLISYDYLDADGEKNMKKSQYHGTDKSMVYNYFYSPLCGWIVNNITPNWMS